MPAALDVHDPRDERASHVTGAAPDCYTAVCPGTAVQMVLLEEPSILMASLYLQLGESLAQDIVEADGAWRVTDGLPGRCVDHLNL